MLKQRLFGGKVSLLSIFVLPLQPHFENETSERNLGEASLAGRTGLAPHGGALYSILPTIAREKCYYFGFQGTYG